MLLKRSVIGICIFLMLLIGLHGVACAAECTVIPFVSPDAHALLLQYGNEYILVGGADEEAIQQELKELGIERLWGVLAPCSHEEHIGSIETLAAHYNAAVITEQEPLVLAGAEFNWQSEGFQLLTDKEVIAFGASSAIEDGIAYRCDGTVWEFFAQTNEGAVNVRGTATTKGKRVGQLKRGSYLTVTGTTRNANNEVWYLVTLSDGTKGYIRHDLVAYASADEMEKQAQATKENQNQKYIGNKKTKKFHRTSCGSLPSAKNQVYFSSRSYAVSIGYKPCSNCDP